MFTRTIQRLRCCLLSLQGYPTPSRYVQHPFKRQHALGTPYILIEYINPSRSNLWSLAHDINSCSHSIAKIGSFTLYENGYLSLSNRPLTLEIQQLENEHIPVDIPRNVTHTTVDSYLNDIIAFHESRLRHQPNAVTSFEDGIYQTSALMVMKSVWSCFFRREFLRGPFFLNLTDLNQSNILSMAVGTSTA
jgi:hypothetical protein